MNGVTRTVFIVDDAPQVRRSLLRVLAAAGYQVRAFESAEDFLGEHEADAPGCLLLDIGLPGLTGIELQRAWSGSPNTPPIVFLTGMGDVQTSVDAMKEGAVDFLTKPIDSVRLFAAIEEAFRRDEAQRRQVSIRRAIQQRLDTLTPRERQVMACVIRGRLNKQIAVELGREDRQSSPRTRDEEDARSLCTGTSATRCARGRRNPTSAGYWSENTQLETARCAVIKAARNAERPERGRLIGWVEGRSFFNRAR
jgi:FixJ family two-component response regulator